MAEDDEGALAPADSDDGTELTVRISEIVAESYSGPIPKPERLRDYEVTLPGAADRILTMAEQAASHRHDMQRGSLELQTFDLRSAYGRSRLGLYLGALVALAVVAVGAYMAFLGHSAEGAGVVISTVVGLAATFVYGARIRRRESESDEQQ